MSASMDQALGLPNFSLRDEEDGGGLSATTPTPLATDVAYIQQTAEQLKIEEPALDIYTKLQHVQLTKLQFELLEAITSDKLHEASLRDIVGAFKILKDKELVASGKPTEIHGLVGYLQILEDEENGIVDVTPAPEKAVPNL